MANRQERAKLAYDLMVFHRQQLDQNSFTDKNIVSYLKAQEENYQDSYLELSEDNPVELHDVLNILQPNSDNDITKPLNPG